MKGYAEKVLIKVPSESEAIYFCSFTNEEAFIKGYWVFWVESLIKDGKNTPMTLTNTFLLLEKHGRQIKITLKRFPIYLPKRIYY